MLALVTLSAVSFSASRPPAVLHRCSPCMMAAELPGSPKELAEEASLGVQAALSAGCRRLEVVVPDGLCFFGQQGKQMLGDPDIPPPRAMRDKADREAAYLVCEMFQALGDDVVCVLDNEDQVQIAAREWAKGGLKTRLVASATELYSRGGGGFGGGGADTSPPRVVVVTRANKQKLADLDPVIAPLGDEVVVVTVNPTRLKKGGSRAGYVPAFLLRDNPHPQWRGGFMCHRFGEQWLLGVAASGSRAIIHGRSTERPGLDDIDRGFANVKDDGSLVSKTGGLLSGAGAAAALERRVPKEE